MSQLRYDLRYQNNIPKCNKGFQYALCLVQKGAALLLLSCLWVLFPFQAQSQSQQELESRRNRLLSEIRTTDKKLTQTRANKAGALEEYLAIQAKVETRQKLVSMLAEQVQILEASIEQTNKAIASLDEDMERLMQEYGKMAQVAYRQKMTGSTLLFILSATGLNDVMRRWRYIKQYEAYRQKQAKLIVETRETLAYKIQKLESDKERKQKSLQLEEKQKVLLDAESKRKNRLVRQLKSDEIALIQELDEQRLREQELQKAIEGIILAETRRAARRNKREEASGEKVEEVFGDLAANFASSKGQLSWPVKGGKIVKGFGKHQHPKYKNVVTQNNGIDIQCGSKAVVRAIFNGSVSHRQFVPGNKNMVIIAHEKFYSVYANLETVAVSRDQKLSKGDVIGQLGKNKSILHFEIWRNQTRLNPTEWIKRTNN